MGTKTHNTKEMSNRMQITIGNIEEKWASKDGQKHIYQVTTSTGKKYKDDTGDFQIGQSYSVSIEEKDGRFGKEYWARIEGAATSAPAAVAAPAAKAAFVPENKNRSFALSYAKDITVALLDSPDQQAKVDPITTTLTIADSYLEWLDGKKPVVDADDLPY